MTRQGTPCGRLVRLGLVRIGEISLTCHGRNDWPAFHWQDSSCRFKCPSKKKGRMQIIYGILCALGGAKTCTMALLNIYQNLKCQFLIQKLLSGFDWSVCVHPLLFKNGHGKSQFFADDFPFKCSITGDFQLPCLIRRVAHIYTGCGIPHSWSVIIPNTSWSVQSLMSPRIISQPLLKSIHSLFGGYEKSLLRHGCMAPCDRCQSSLLARLSCQLLK